MPNNQVRIRRDTATNLATATPADGELAYNTTDDRLHLGDGTTAGGIEVPNFRDLQNGRYVYIAAGGTADALTFTLTKAPSSYVEGLEFRAKGTASNTTTTPTGNVNGLGAKNFKKYSGGAKVNLAVGDIWNGFQMIIRYDGTDLVILNVPSTSGLTSVSQGNLNTATGTFSQGSLQAAGGADTWDVGDDVGGTRTGINLPGGQYGFAIQTYISTNDFTGGWVFGSTNTSSYTTTVFGFNRGNNLARTVYGQQRYVTASPPFDLGDGEASGFVFLMVNSAGEIVSTYAADVPPWAYNGPTRINADYIDAKTGKKFKKVIKKRTIEEVLAGKPSETEIEEITQEIKNRDMPLIPHPFSGATNAYTVCLLDPMDARIKDLLQAQNDGDPALSEAIGKGQIYCDNISLRRKGPQGVHIGRMRYKNSKAGS